MSEPGEDGYCLVLSPTEHEAIRKFEKKLLENIKDMPPEYAKTLNDNFWDLI